MSNGGSGIYLDANDKDAFVHFLKNSTSTYLTSGSFGLTFILTLNPGVESKYKSLHPSTYSQPVQQILLKTSFIYPLQLSLSVKPPNKDVENKHTATVDDFYNEVNVQTDVYLKTMQYLEPLCPAIVYADVLNDMNQPLMSDVYAVISPCIPSKTQSLIDSYPGLGIGIIAMEIVGSNPDTVKPLHNFMENTEFYYAYISKAYHTLIELIIQTGYNHGDFHGCNLLVDIDNTDYFAGKRGKVSIIDFGFSEKLSNKNYKKIKGLYDKQKYTDILTLLCDIPRKDGYNMRDFSGYSVMCLLEQPRFTDDPTYIVNKREINNKIIELYQKRDESINNLISTFTHKHLPLSNSEKNHIYNGPRLDKQYITHFDNIYDLFNMPSNIDNIMKQMFTTKVNRFRKESRASYMLMYLLNRGFENTIDIHFAVMIYAGVFDGMSMDDVFTTVKNYVNKEKLKASIYSCSILQGIYFHDFLDYFTDDQLNEVSQDQLERQFRRDDWLFHPETAAKQLKQIAKIKSHLRTVVVKPKKENMFKELPFQDVKDVEIILNPERAATRKIKSPPRPKIVQTLRKMLLSSKAKIPSPSKMKSPQQMKSPRKTVKRVRESPYQETSNKKARACNSPDGKCIISGGGTRKKR